MFQIACPNQQPGGLQESLKVILYVPKSGGVVVDVVENLQTLATKEGKNHNSLRKIIESKKPYDSKFYKKEVVPRYATNSMLDKLREKGVPV